MAMAEPLPATPKASTPPKAPALIAAALLIAIPLATQFEGFRGKAYSDPAHILTQCYGETEGVDPSRIYSKDECAAKLRARLARDYAPLILKCLPQLDMEHRHVFGALLDAGYNAGPAAVCKSRMAVSIRAGDWAGACRGFIGWYVTTTDRRTGVSKALPGLVRRRQAEANACSTMPAPPIGVGR